MWLKLRGSYRDAVRRQKKSIKSGAAAESIKLWKFQKQMSFLDPFMSTGPREGNLNTQSDEDSQGTADQQILSTDGADGTLSDVVNEDIEESDVVPRGNEGESSTPKRLPVPHAFNKPVNKKKKDDTIRSMLQHSMEMRHQRARERSEERRSLIQNNSDDPLYNFFISMYQQTKTMPPYHQHRIKCQLFQSVSQAEEEILNSGQQSSTMSSPSPSSLNSPNPAIQTWSNSPQQYEVTESGATLSNLFSSFK